MNDNGLKKRTKKEETNRKTIIKTVIWSDVLKAVTNIMVIYEIERIESILVDETAEASW